LVNFGYVWLTLVIRSCTGWCKNGAILAQQTSSRLQKPTYSDLFQGVGFCRLLSGSVCLLSGFVGLVAQKIGSPQITLSGFVAFAQGLATEIYGNTRNQHSSEDRDVHQQSTISHQPSMERNGTFSFQNGTLPCTRICRELSESQSLPAP
jgi:hypothetical protein